MKKILTLAIAAVLVFSLVSCAKKDKEDVTTGTSAADVQKNGPKSALEILETVFGGRQMCGDGRLREEYEGRRSR